jgi:hypothetical protein
MRRQNSKHGNLESNQTTMLATITMVRPVSPREAAARTAEF